MALPTNTLAVALATKAGAVSGVQSAAQAPVDGVPGTPFMYVGPVKIIQLIPGSWDYRRFHFPLIYLLGRSGSEYTDQVAINDALDNVVAAWRSGITLGVVVDGSAPIAQIISADTDKFYTLGGQDYQGIEFIVEIDAYSTQSYTA